MTTLAEIEASSKTYADARAKLAAAVAELNSQIDAARRQLLPSIKRELAKAAQRQDELRTLIESAPELFVKPRTLIFHGVKLGYQKGKGGIAFDDAAQVVKLIRRHLPEQAETLIALRESPIKDALANLPVTDLKRIGCTVIETGDAVVIKPTDSEVDKMVDALLKDATDVGVQQ